MKYVFTNGNAEQQNLWRAAVGQLLNFPADAIPLEVEVTFEPAGGIGQTAFAETTWTYDSNQATTKVRNDAPGFGDVDAALIAEAAGMGLSYNTHRFYGETAIHELAHALYAALPESFRISIAQLFGAKSDDTSELNPEGKDWHDRISEAIAETFKEAFLPRRFRVFPNRTNIKLSYSEFPRFRRLFREGAESVAIEGGGETIAEQMAELPLIDNLNRGPQWVPAEFAPPPGALIEPPWEQWAPAEHPGFTYNRNAFQRRFYKAAVITPGEDRLPHEVAALYTDLPLVAGAGNGFGAWVTWGEEQVGTPGKMNPEGEINVFAAGALPGSGYKLVVRTREILKEAEFTRRYWVRLERWTLGSAVVLAEDESALARVVGSDWGLTVMNGKVTAWVRSNPPQFPGEPILPTDFVEICSAKDFTYKGGLCGIGLIRNNNFGNGSVPGLADFHAGVLVPSGEEVIGSPIEVPEPALEPSGAASGRHPTRRPTSGYVH